MAAYDHCYGKFNFELSEYAKKLDPTSKQLYIDKLMIVQEDGASFCLRDPYLIKKEDWIKDVSRWPTLPNTNINAFLNLAPGKNVRSKNAYTYVVEGKVQNVGVFYPVGLPDIVILNGFINPSQKCNAEPHKAWALLEKNHVKSAHCTCIAGFGEVCSHVAALLYRFGLAESCKITTAPTEKLCEWKNSFSKKVKSVRLKDVNFKRVKLNESNAKPIKRTQSRNVSPIRNELINKLRKVSPKSVIFTAIKDGSSTDSASEGEENDAIPPTMIDIIKTTPIKEVKSLHQFFNEENLKELELKTRGQRSDSLWHSHRVGRITSSNFGLVFKNKKATTSFLEKFVKVPCEINVPAVKWGNKKENTAYHAYINFEKNNHVNFHTRKAGLYVSSSDPYLAASPDGIIHCDCCGYGVLEIKCPYKHRNTDPGQIASTDSGFYLNTEGNLKEEHNYYSQIQGQMAITNTDYCDFVVWTSVALKINRIRRDPHFWSRKKPVLENFYFKEIIPILKEVAETNQSIEEHTSIKNMGAAGPSCEHP